MKLATDPFRLLSTVEKTPLKGTPIFAVELGATVSALPCNPHVQDDIAGRHDSHVPTLLWGHIPAPCVPVDLARQRQSNVVATAAETRKQGREQGQSLYFNTAKIVSPGGGFTHYMYSRPTQAGGVDVGLFSLCAARQGVSRRRFSHKLARVRLRGGRESSDRPRSLVDPPFCESHRRFLRRWSTRSVAGRRIATRLDTRLHLVRRARSSEPKATGHHVTFGSTKPVREIKLKGR